MRRQNIAKRLAFAKEHVHWSINDQWANVLFSDESKLEIFGTKRRLLIRRFDGERYKKYCLQPTGKHGGGSVMIWGAISVEWRGHHKVGTSIQLNQFGITSTQNCVKCATPQRILCG